MAGDEIAEATLVEDEHDEMPFRLRDIELQKSFADIHSVFTSIDRLRKEWKFQFRLLRHEWNSSHYIALATGFAAFLLGSLSGEVFSGGDAAVTGKDGLMMVGGFDFFQIITSGILWVWFIVQLSVIFPIMRGHVVNVMIVWATAMGGMLFIHSKMPNFPIGFDIGEMLGGIILTIIAGFFGYFFWKAVIETRDLHVQEHHVHTDVRVMERAMGEHSLYAWTFMVVSWMMLVIFNGWAGAHFVADRDVERTYALVLHIISGLLAIFLLMQLLWFPQRMLGTGTRVRTKAATSAEAELIDSSIHISSEGECSSCGAPAPVSVNDTGELLVDCPTENCNRRGIPGSVCEGCDENYPTRLACSDCGVNSPVSDYLPDSEVW